MQGCKNDWIGTGRILATILFFWSIQRLGGVGTVKEMSVTYWRGRGTHRSRSYYAFSLVHTRPRAYAWHVYASLPAFPLSPSVSARIHLRFLVGVHADCVSTLTVRRSTSIKGYMSCMLLKSGRTELFNELIQRDGFFICDCRYFLYH